MNAARPIAFASAAGVALTAIAAGVANAAPATPQSEPQSADLNTTTIAVDDVTTVEVPDIAWTAEDGIAESVTAEAPAAPEPEAAPADETDANASDGAASRSESRGEMSTASSDTSARQAAVNAAGSDIVSVALGLTGIPYVYGGETLGGLDCSGWSSTPTRPLASTCRTPPPLRPLAAPLCPTRSPATSWPTPATSPSTSAAVRWLRRLCPATIPRFRRSAVARPTCATEPLER